MGRVETRPRRRPNVFLLAGGLLGVALFVLVIIIVASDGEDAPATLRPAEIEALYPEPGDQIIGQGEVGADVPQGWTFLLTIDGLLIPDDQLEKVEQLGQYRFKPRPGRVIERLGAGEHTARVDITPLVGGTTVSHSWTFRVGT